MRELIRLTMVGGHLKRLLWLAAGFTLGLALLQVLTVFRLHPEPEGHLATYQAEHQPPQDIDKGVAQPSFPGKLYNVSGEWTIITKDKGPVLKDNTHMDGDEPKAGHPQNINSSDDMEKWLLIQKQRRETIRTYCHQQSAKAKVLTSQQKRHFYRTVLVDSKHQVLYCPVGKVACTSWKTALALLQGQYTGLKPGEHIHDIPVLLRNNIKSLNMLRDTKEVIQRYPIFIFVRHPFERLLSAFKNKFHSERDIMQSKYGRDIIRTYRQGIATQYELDTGNGVRFPEFIRWILSGGVRDIHWEGFDETCHLCTLPYTYIGKMETFQVDTRNILRSLFGTENMDAFPHSNPSAGNSNKLLQDQFKDVSKEDIKRLLQKYDSDFKMFNYTWPMS